MTGSALVLRQQPSIDDIQRVAKAYAVSGYWPDTRDVAQAFVKVQFGYEVGLPAYVAMSEVHIIQGKPTLGAGALSALVKAHPNYDYRVVEHDLEVCAIEFFDARGGESLGVSRFTVDDAKTAGLLSNQTWSKYRRNMLFARAMSNGVAWYAPDVTLGRVYTPEEIGDDAIDDGEVVEDSGLEPSGTKDLAPAADAQDIAAASSAASASSPDVRPGAATPEAADATTTASAAAPPDPTEPADLALLQHADRLEEKLIEHSTALAVDLSLVRDAVAGKRDEHAGEPELLVAWLGQQVGRAEAALAERTAKPKFVAPSGPRGNVTASQVKIWDAAKDAGLTDEERHRITLEVAGCESSKEVPRGQVDAVVAALRGAGVQA